MVEDVVNLKLNKYRCDECLVAMFRAVDHLRIDPVHLSGGKIGDRRIYMFNSKVRFIVYLLSGCRIIRVL